MHHQVAEVLYPRTAGLSDSDQEHFVFFPAEEPLSSRVDSRQMTPRSVGTPAEDVFAMRSAHPRFIAQPSIIGKPLGIQPLVLPHSPSLTPPPTP